MQPRLPDRESLPHTGGIEAQHSQHSSVDQGTHASHSNIHHLVSSSALEQSWEAQEAQCTKLRLLRDGDGELTDPAQVFGVEQLRRAFEPLRPGQTLTVCCSDERCDRMDEHFAQRCTPGVGVLESDAELALFVQHLQSLSAAGVHVEVVDHAEAECGACALAAQKIGDGANPVQLGKAAADRLAKAVHGDLYNPALHRDSFRFDTGRYRMRAKEHDGRSMTIDLSNTLNDAHALDIKPAMQLNRWTDDPQKMLAHIEALVGIMLNPAHAPGAERFRGDDKYIIMVVGEPGNPVFGAKAFIATLEEFLRKKELDGHVEVVGFDAPAAV